MIKNYFIVLVRGMVRRKFYTFINVLGLSTGITFAMLIAIFIAGELSVNQDLKDVDRLFLVQNKIDGEASTIEFFTPALLPRLAVQQYPAQFSDYFKFWDRNITVSKGEKHFRIQSMIGDKSFLRVFGFNVIYGDAKDPLKEVNSMIITEGAAKRFFDRTDVVDETLLISTEQHGIKEYRITAVIAEPSKKNTVTDLMNMNAQIFLSFENTRDFFVDSDSENWDAFTIAYLKLNETAGKDEAQKTLNDLLQKNAPAAISAKRTMELSPLTDYYLVTNHGAVLELVVSLSVIVLFLLALAIANFINISMADSFSRLKEIGIRKVIGGGRVELFIQFLSESLLLTFLSSVFSLLFYTILRPFFNTMLDAGLPAITELKVQFWIWIVAGTLALGFLAGVYPGLFQSGAKPIESLKGKTKSVQGTVSFSRILVTLQFVIATFIIIAAIILSRQTDFFLEKDLGYNKSNVLVVYSVPRLWNEEGFGKMEAARAEFLQSSKLKSVSLSWGTPEWGIGGFENVVYKDGSDRESGAKVNITGGDENFIDVFGLRLTEGNFLFAPSESWQQGRLVLNQSAANVLHVRVGDELKIDGDSVTYSVSGIVQDFNYQSMHERVKPLAIMHPRDYTSYRCFSFRIESASPAIAVKEVEALWKKVFPNEPFDFYFADEKLTSLYKTELQLKKASSVATVLMLVVVMTGVIGLVSLNVSKRKKEVGVRKVLGASVTRILLMFSHEYGRLMLVSFLIAMPLAYSFAANWLQNFVYHISLSWWMFILPGLFLLLITIVLVSIQSYRTAVTNPVKSLRYE